MWRTRSIHYIALALALIFAPATAAAQTVDYNNATIADLLAAVERGTLTSERLVQISVARIEAYDRKGPAASRVISCEPTAMSIG